MSGYAGGSGGGGAFWNWTQGGSGVAGQGYAGGASTIGNGPNGQYWLAGGGGGAGASPVNTGSNYTSSHETGDGGIGLITNITGTAKYYGGGGGGGSPDWNNPGTVGGFGGVVMGDITMEALGYNQHQVLQILVVVAEEAGGAVPQLMADQALLFSILVLHRT